MSTLINSVSIFGSSVSTFISSISIFVYKGPSFWRSLADSYLLFSPHPSLLVSLQKGEVRVEARFRGPSPGDNSTTY
jgi:hypothetical protein